jgi:hypothetical protein
MFQTLVNNEVGESKKASMQPTILERSGKEVQDKFYQGNPMDVSASGEQISFNISNLKQGLPKEERNLQDNSFTGSPGKLLLDES